MQTVTGMYLTDTARTINGNDVSNLRVLTQDQNGVWGGPSGGTDTIIVQNIPAGWHQADQIIIKQNADGTSTLYVGIGVRTKDGALDYPNPGNARDMAYGGTISEILDLKQVNGLVTDSAGFGLTGVATSNSDPDYSNAGPYTSTAVNKLIIQSSGARNPFGLALDGSGDLWFTNNFNRSQSDGTFNGTIDPSTGLLYGITTGDPAPGPDLANNAYDQFFEDAPLADYGYNNSNWRNDAADDNPSVTSEAAVNAGFFNFAEHGVRSTTFDNLVAPPGGFAEYNESDINQIQGLGPSTSADGAAFYTGTRFPATYQGDAFIARWNSTVSDSTGHSITYNDLVAVDPTTGNVRIIANQFDNPVAVLYDGSGNMIIADYGDSAIYRLATTVSQLVVTTEPPSSVAAGAAFGLKVTAEDKYGNVVKSFTSSATVSLSANPGGSTLGGTLTVTPSNGVASYSNLTLNKVDTGYVLKVSAGGLSVTTTAIAVTPAAAAKLVITTQPPSSVTAGSDFRLGVTAEDKYGNVVTSYSGSVTVALSSNPGGSTLGGTLAVTASHGVATFTNLTLNKAASGYTIKTSSGSLTTATTTAITVTPAAASQLVVTTEPPSSVAAGAAFGLKVTAEDKYGNVVKSFTSSATVSLSANPGGSTLGGTLTVTPSNGVASYSNLTLNKVDSGYVLKVSAGGLSVTTTAIAVTPAAAAKLVITTQPPSSVTAGSDFRLGVTAEDKYGNVVTSYSGSVTVALSSNPGGSTLGGTLAVTASHGVATFTNLTLNKAASGYTIKTSSGSLTTATTTAITVTPAAASQLLVTTEPPSSVTAGAGFGLKVTAEDKYGNVVKSFTSSATVSLSANPGGSTLGGTLTVTPSNGVASYSNLTLNKVDSGYVLKVSAGGLSVTTTAIAVTPAAAAKLVITTQPPSSVTAGSDFRLGVTAEDKYGNVVTSYSGSVTVALSSNPGGSTLGGTLAVTASHGVATFTNLTLNKAASGYTIKTSSGSLTTATTTAITVTPAAASQLVVTTEPPSSVAAGAAFGLKVTAEDKYGNVVKSFTSSATVSLSANPGGSTLGGTLTVTPSNGVASYSNLTLNKVDSGYVLKVSAGGLSVTTTAIAVTPAAAAKLVITTQPPSSVTAGSDFRLGVTAEDKYGNVVTSYSGSVTVALSSNPGGSTLGGTLAVTASHGVATFTNLTLNKAASGYTIKTSSGSLTTATTTAITVRASTATQLVVTTEPPSSVTAGAGFVNGVINGVRSG